MLFKAFKETAKATPQGTAMVCGEMRLSYEELLERVESFCEGLRSLGFREGDCLAVLLPNCSEFVIAFYAVTALGGIVLPLNHLFKAEEIEFYLKDSIAKFIVTDNCRLQTCREIFDGLPNHFEVIVTDNPQKTEKFFYDLMLPRTGDLDGRPIDPRSTAVYQYSSGSTGRPKCVPRTQHNLWSEVQNFRLTTHIASSDCILCTVPLYHAHGLGNCLLAATCNGATLVILEQPLKNGLPVEVPFVFRCQRVLELIQAEKITLFPAVPYIFSALAETPAYPNMNLETLRLCFSAGNFLNKSIFDKFLQRYGVPIRQLYGCTEAGSISINLSADIEVTSHSVGCAIENVKIQIVNDAGDYLPANEIGEIVIKSDALTKGYSGMPDLNEQVFKDGAFYTGDLGKLDREGRLYITGRKKILIDTGGRKVDPIEIEDILLSHPKVKEAVVVGTEGNHAGEIIKAVVVLNRPEICSEQEIFIHCKERLAEFKVPKIVEFLDEIPKSPLGKVLRKALV